MRGATNIRDIASLGPDYMGFIFHRGSKRFVGNNFRIPQDIPGTVKKVGVFVDEATSSIERLVIENRLDVVQLHGKESPEKCHELRSKGYVVIKAFNIGSDFDFTGLVGYVNEVDFFLFDAKGEQPGGNGVLFNWQQLTSYDQRVPFFLAGGISPEIIENIGMLSEMNLHAIDVNSGVETSPAIKDKNLVLEVINKMKMYAI